jgi:hypothetical protein
LRIVLELAAASELWILQHNPGALEVCNACPDNGYGRVAQTFLKKTLESSDVRFWVFQHPFSVGTRCSKGDNGQKLFISKTTIDVTCMALLFFHTNLYFVV